MAVVDSISRPGGAPVNTGGTIDYFIDTTYNVPTRSEAFKYAAYDALQRLNPRE